MLARPEGSEASPVCVSLAPNTDTHSLFLSPSLQGLSKLSRPALPGRCLPSPGRLTPWPHGPVSPALFLAPSPRPPLAARPSQGQAVLEKCWEVAECAVFEFPPNWRPDPWTNSGVFAVHKGLCSPSRPGDPGQPACGGWAGGGRTARPAAPGREARTGRVMTGLPPAGGPPTLRRAVRPRAGRGPASFPSAATGTFHRRWNSHSEEPLPSSGALPIRGKLGCAMPPCTDPGDPV